MGETPLASGGHPDSRIRRIRFTYIRNCARTFSRTVQSMVIFLRTVFTSSRAIIFRVGSPSTATALSFTARAS
jgi:hypothetical protein